MKSDLIVHIIQTKIQNYILITRQDKPTGWMLLFIPCLFGIFSASIHKNLPIDLKVIILFLIGSILMRSAGCIFNDIVDRDIDAKVERTKNRPLANKSMSLYEAIFLLLTLLIFSFLILISLNKLTIILGFASIILVVLYPFMKRITYWPQLFLGLTFNWGVIMAWSAMNNSLSSEIFILYVSATFWTLGYDTIYGAQDMSDDEIIGLKSTAIKFKENIRIFVSISYLLSILLICFLFKSFLGINIFSLFLLLFISSLFYQLINFKNKKKSNYLKLFKFNNYSGLLLFLAFLNLN